MQHNYHYVEFFRDYLLQTGVPADQIITLELDNDLNAR